MSSYDDPDPAGSRIIFIAKLAAVTISLVVLITVVANALRQGPPTSGESFGNSEQVTATQRKEERP